MFAQDSTPGHFIVTGPATGTSMFYRILVGGGNPGTAPEIQKISFQGQNIVISFVAPGGTPLSAFAILGSITPNGNYTEIPGVAFANGPLSGDYTATFSSSTPNRFFKVRMTTGGAGGILRSQPRGLVLD